MTVKGGTSQACAACKYQRRKCASDCSLAPYFPPDQPKTFQNAHRLFGVSKISKILKQLTPTQKNDAMGSIIFQANMREKFPVHGCYGYICQLRFQIDQLQQELHAVQTQIGLYRQHHSSSPPQPSPQLQLGMAIPPSPNNALPLFHHSHHQNFNAMPTGISLAPINHHSPFSSSINGNNAANNGNAYNTAIYMDSNDNMVSPLWIQDQNDVPNSCSNNNSAAAASQSPLLFSIQQEPTEAHYDEIPPFFDTIDDSQSYIDSKEAYDSSSEDSLKDTTQPIEHVQENELKSVAACFNFTTSVN
ncbi:hypothetical protein NE237_021283 [Protea cynaroides]|uniref:LOB domain-containing protein n=1 Tax=Protea cynaroides TaxID=273540 RepID=A0A9Q0HAU7_9MAGN|nr:hypothetical protein NE237_021283 [Protea cynaroides]